MIYDALLDTHPKEPQPNPDSICSVIRPTFRHTQKRHPHSFVMSLMVLRRQSASQSRGSGGYQGAALAAMTAARVLVMFQLTLVLLMSAHGNELQVSDHPLTIDGGGAPDSCPAAPVGFVFAPGMCISDQSCTSEHCDCEGAFKVVHCERKHMTTVAECWHAANTSCFVDPACQYFAVVADSGCATNGRGLLMFVQKLRLLWRSRVKNGI
jgi:hypothetical protein